MHSLMYTPSSMPSDDPTKPKQAPKTADLLIEPSKMRSNSSMPSKEVISPISEPLEFQFLTKMRSYSSMPEEEIEVITEDNFTLPKPKPKK